MVDNSMIKLTSKQVEILGDSMMYLHNMNLAKKHLLFFDTILEKTSYEYEKLEENLEYIINNCKPTIELGKFVYLLSLINAGSVSWLMSIKTKNSNTPYSPPMAG